MQAKRRYLLVLTACAFLVLVYFGGYRLKQLNFRQKRALDFIPTHQSYLSISDIKIESNLVRYSVPNTSFCRMETCFDFSKCRQNFKVYLYGPDDSAPPSESYQKILNIIRESVYYTANPEDACLYILHLDTLDRDTLSVDYVRNIAARLQGLELWNNGKNHVLFNLYSGTWPDYSENLGFDFGQAIIARASGALNTIRPGFDISLPLFPKNHPERGGEPGLASTNNFPLTKKYLLAFKGKRYVYGIGSETRNSLYHLHNGRDMVLVTTCRHGKSWKDLKDERCDVDNAEFDRYDYEVLLSNSTFCLVPRGRRLGSFRFLEALQAGCIPVLLSNNWALPFHEIIRWEDATVQADERLLLQVPEMIRSLSPSRILELRQQSQLLWERYFSSVEKIVFSTLEMIRDRVQNHLSRDGALWNSLPGGLLSLPKFAMSRKSLPFLNLGGDPGNTFTAVIHAQLGSPNLTPVTRLLRNIARSSHAHRILVIWTSERTPPAPSKWPVLGIPCVVVTASSRSISQRFQPHELIETAGVLALDEDAVLTTDEIDFAFKVWQSFPERIVGYPARSHFWDDAKGMWGYTSKWTNEYSMVLTSAAFYHSYYHHLYWEWLSPLAHKTVEQSQNCEDILMNFLISHVSRRPPIKVTQRKQYKEQPSTGLIVNSISKSPWNDPDHFIQRQGCLNTFAVVFGYMPLLRSNMRLDPVLFKDPVSNLRKRYRQMETIGS